MDAAGGAGRKRKIIQPTAEDLSNVEFETSEDVQVIPTFDQMNLREELLRGIYSYGNCFKYQIYHSLSGIFCFRF